MDTHYGTYLHLIFLIWLQNILWLFVFFIICNKKFLCNISVFSLYEIILSNLSWLNKWQQIFQLALCGARQETKQGTSRCEHLNQHQNISRATNLPSDDYVTHRESYRTFGTALPLIHNCRSGSCSDRAWNLDPHERWQWEMFACHYHTAIQQLQQSQYLSSTYTLLMDI